MHDRSWYPLDAIAIKFGCYLLGWVGSWLDTLLKQWDEDKWKVETKEILYLTGKIYFFHQFLSYHRLWSTFHFAWGSAFAVSVFRRPCSRCTATFVLWAFAWCLVTSCTFIFFWNILDIVSISLHYFCAVFRFYIATFQILIFRSSIMRILMATHFF